MDLSYGVPYGWDRTLLRRQPRSGDVYIHTLFRRRMFNPFPSSGQVHGLEDLIRLSSDTRRYQ